MHILFSQTGMVAYKQDMMDTACVDGRYPTSSKELYYSEAEEIINALKQKAEKCDTMRKKVISLCRQAGMAINGKADMKHIYEWVQKYGHATDGKGNNKHFNKYTYHELPKLITQAEAMLNKYLKAV